MIKQLYKPTNASNTQMEHFRLYCEKRFSKSFSSYSNFHKWSCDNYKDFWPAVWDYTNIISSQKSLLVCQDLPMQQIPKWFLGAKLNFAQNFLHRKDLKTALICSNENGSLNNNFSYADLNNSVHALSESLRNSGVKPGDRVAGYIPNIAEAVIGMLAATAIGAIWSSASPDFGVSGVLERFVQIKPKVLISVDRVFYNGKWHPHYSKLKEVVKGLEGSLEVLLVVEYGAKLNSNGGVIGTNEKEDLNQCLTIEKAKSFDSYLIEPKEEMVFEQLPFDHPVYILFSSGTTGKPKCIVHGAGGMLIQHKKELIIHADMTEKDVFFYYSTCGWMMWNWLVSGLTLGLTLVLYDGSPFKPTPNRLFELIDEFNITYFGVSAKYVQSLQTENVFPIKQNSLKSLKTILSTGSPLSPENFDYLYQNVKKDVLVGSITGGTDIASLFAGLNASLPVYRGEIQSKCLGMDLEAWDESGNPVTEGAGDLVCVKPFPCMPVFFYDDKNNEKYTQAYFSRFEGVWYHGDYIYFSPETDGVVMMGRSDGTLNPGGVRFGSAELYHVLESFEELDDTLAVGQKIGADERVVLFCKMKTGFSFDDKLVKKVQSEIRRLLSPRHVPALVLPISEIPYTLTGKKVEIAVKRIISGEKLLPSGALANPKSLDLFYNIPELKAKK